MKLYFEKGTTEDANGVHWFARAYVPSADDKSYDVDELSGVEKNNNDALNKYNKAMTTLHRKYNVEE